MGINPSTAAPDALDPTLQSVQRIALSNGYDSFLMFNVYAQRATRPDDMERALNPALHAENRKAFRYLLSLSPLPLPSGAAWGNVIEKRDYLHGLRAGLRRTDGQAAGARWYTAGPLLKSGHPHHPLYLKAGPPPCQPFDMAEPICPLPHMSFRSKTRLETRDQRTAGGKPSFLRRFHLLLVAQILPQRKSCHQLFPELHGLEFQLVARRSSVMRATSSSVSPAAMAAAEHIRLRRLGAEGREAPRTTSSAPPPRR